MTTINGVINYPNDYVNFVNVCEKVIHNRYYIQVPYI